MVVLLCREFVKDIRLTFRGVLCNNFIMALLIFIFTACVLYGCMYVIYLVGR
jgi:hypothetical protein